MVWIAVDGWMHWEEVERLGDLSRKWLSGDKVSIDGDCKCVEDN